MGREDFAALAAKIVAAYAGNHVITQDELLTLLTLVTQALIDVSEDRVRPAAEPVASKPVVPISKSISPDYLICLEDGMKYKSLKRHLRASFGLTPSEYRQKWGLPSDYPMVAPNYRIKRSRLAKSTGLGRRPETARKPKRQD